MNFNFGASPGQFGGAGTTTPGTTFSFGGASTATAAPTAPITGFGFGATTGTYDTSIKPIRPPSHDSFTFHLEQHQQPLLPLQQLSVELLQELLALVSGPRVVSNTSSQHTNDTYQTTFSCFTSHLEQHQQPLHLLQQLSVELLQELLALVLERPLVSNTSFQHPNTTYQTTVSWFIRLSFAAAPTTAAPAPTTFGGATGFGFGAGKYYTLINHPIPSDETH